jgi:UPF0755 protein
MTFQTDQKRKFMKRRIWVALILVLVLVSILFLNRSSLRGLYDQIAGRDYAGSGHGQVAFEISKGETGEEIATALVKQDVVKSFDIVYREMISRGASFYPGVYSLRQQMSAWAALDALANPSNLQVTNVTVQEGLRIGQVLKKLAAASGIPITSFEAASKRLETFGLPSDAPSLEGYLFPATYSFAANSSAEEILGEMVDRCFEELDRYGVSKDHSLTVLTLASIIQKEARKTDDFYKVSRVFTNRLAIDMPLQSDATVSYGSGGTTVTTTDAERADRNGYNTYVHRGLPIGPISAPGSLAIDAALHPVDGKWIFFCAVNLKTGETVFSVTGAEHSAAVAKFRAWMAEHPGWNG